MINWQQHKRRIIIIAIIVVVIGVYLYNRDDGKYIEPVTSDYEDRWSNEDFTGAMMEQSAPTMGRESLDVLSAPNKARGLAEEPVSGAAEAKTDRKVVRSGALDLVVDKAEEAARQVQALAEGAGGWVESLRVYDVGDSQKNGSVIIRVPADKFKEVMENLKGLAINVESEVVNAADVTDQYVDMEARLKNMRAEEEQYLAILKQAEDIEDILNVTQRLHKVRERIERMEAQLKLLAEEIKMSSITVSLTAEGDIEVFGVHWRPMVVVRQATREMLESLTGYVDAMIKFVFAVPALLLWLVTWAVGLLIVWKVGKAIKRKWFSKNLTSN